MTSVGFLLLLDLVILIDDEDDDDDKIDFVEVVSSLLTVQVIVVSCVDGFNI